MTDAADSRSTVLVVDDTPESLSFLTDTLDGAGLTVLIATSGEAALELIEHITPDLVLMDAVMPGLDGFETTRRIKRDPRFQHLPIVFMTGLTETEHVVAGLQAGGVDYVNKPIVVDELLARIRVHLGNARVTQGIRAGLDASGRFLFATDGDDRVLWATPRADSTMARIVPDWADAGRRLSPTIAQTLKRLQRGELSAAPTARIELEDARLEFTLLDRTPSAEYVFRLTESRAGDEQRALQERYALTSREAEVLLWISRGKANREISEILGISPRTVNKHLEQVFEKLGVENRASAAAFAVQTLARG